jgi:ABC-type multidrug transport system permease subunit
MFVFSFAVIWIGVMLASLVSTPEAVQGIAFVVIFPITFIASTFVPTSTLPGVLKTFAEWNPTSSLANSLRHQFGNPGGATPHDAIFPIAHPFAYTLIWAVAIVLVCAPLSVALYQRSIRT